MKRQIIIAMCAAVAFVGCGQTDTDSDTMNEPSGASSSPSGIDQSGAGQNQSGVGQNGISTGTNQQGTGVVTNTGAPGTSGTSSNP